MTHATQFLPRCDRVVLLSKGKIVDQGTYQKVFDDNPSFHPILKVYLLIIFYNQLGPNLGGMYCYARNSLNPSDDFGLSRII